MTRRTQSGSQVSNPSMVPDYHLHTALCGHATGTTAQYRQAAAQAGIPEICFAEHAPNPDGVGCGVCIEAGDFPRYREMVTALQDGSPPAVLFGIEADYYPGCEKNLSTWLPQCDFDLVMGSVHFIDDWGFDNPAELDAWNGADIEDTWRRYFGLVMKMAGTRLFDVIAHFDLPKKFGHRLPDPRMKELAGPVMDSVASAGMAIEINTSGLRRAVGEAYPSAFLLSLARERGIPICFSSDAHAPEEVGFGFDKALRLARGAGYTDYVRYRKRSPCRVGLPPEPAGAP